MSMKCRFCSFVFQEKSFILPYDGVCSNQQNDVYNDQKLHGFSVYTVAYNPTNDQNNCFR